MGRGKRGKSASSSSGASSRLVSWEYTFLWWASDGGSVTLVWKSSSDTAHPEAECPSGHQSNGIHWSLLLVGTQRQRRVRGDCPFEERG